MLSKPPPPQMTHGPHKRGTHLMASGRNSGKLSKVGTLIDNTRLSITRKHHIQTHRPCVTFTSQDRTCPLKPCDSMSCVSVRTKGERRTREEGLDKMREAITAPLSLSITYIHHKLTHTHLHSTHSTHRQVIIKAVTCNTHTHTYIATQRSS